MCDEPRQIERISTNGPSFRIPTGASFPKLGVFHILVMGLCVAVMIYDGLGKAIGSLSPLPFNIFIVLFGATIFIYALASGRRAKRRTHLRMHGPLPCEGDDSSRLQVRNPEDEFAEFGPFADVSFEPRWYMGSFAVRRPFQFVALQWAVGAAFVVLGFLLDMRLGSPIGGMISIYVVTTAAVLSAVLIAFLKPISLCVKPGRLEVITYAWYRQQATSMRTFNLGKAKIWIDLPQRRVFIQNGDDRLGISLELLPRRREFAFMLLLGAISTHEPGPAETEESA